MGYLKAFDKMDLKFARKLSIVRLLSCTYLIYVPNDVPVSFTSVVILIYDAIAEMLKSVIVSMINVSGIAFTVFGNT